jgi:hypothetical protein
LNKSGTRYSIPLKRNRQSFFISVTNRLKARFVIREQISSNCNIFIKINSESLREWNSIILLTESSNTEILYIDFILSVSVILLNGRIFISDAFNKKILTLRPGGPLNFYLFNLKDSIQDSLHRLAPLFSYKVSFQHCVMKLINIHTSCVTCYVQSSKLWLTHNKSPNRESQQLFETKIKYKLLSGRIYIFIVLHSLKRRLMIKANTGFGPHNLTISCTNFLTLSAP